MAALGELLFYRRDQASLDDILRHQVGLLQKRVDDLPDKLFSEKSDGELADHVATEAALQPLKIDLSAAKANVQEREVEVTDRFAFERGPIRVPGLHATKAIPFEGDPALWWLRPNPYDMNPPRGEVRGKNLIVGITVRAHEAEEAVRYIDDTIARIQEYLQRQEAQIARHNASLSGQAMRWITVRRQRLGSASDLLKKLGG